MRESLLRPQVLIILAMIVGAVFALKAPGMASANHTGSISKDVVCSSYDLTIDLDNFTDSSDRWVLVVQSTAASGEPGTVVYKAFHEDDVDDLAIPPASTHTGEFPVTPSWFKLYVLGNGVTVDEEVGATIQTLSGLEDSVNVVFDDDYTCGPIENPGFPESCTMDVALVLDASGSINGAELLEMQDAMKLLVGALLTANSEFAVVEFASTASVIGGWSGEQATVDGWIDDVGDDDLGDFTNWHDALVDARSQLPNRDGVDDLIIFASDGEPNRVGDPAVEVSEDAAVAAAVAQANLAKADGVHILAIGIGVADETNLQALSGTGELDYVATGFGTFAEDIEELVNASCEQIKCVNGDFVLTTPDTQDTGDCRTVQICLNGASFTVTEYDLDTDSRLDDAELGDCDATEEPPTVVQVAPTPIPPTPIPAPVEEVEAAVEVVESITPPSTGDAGLKGEGSSLPYAAAGVLALLGVATLVLRRDASES
jgi:uncharacterized protein YegL